MQNKKRPYQKPVVKKVPLMAEEAVLSSCKMGKGATVGPGFAKCEQSLGMGQTAPCSAFGS